MDNFTREEAASKVGTRVRTVAAIRTMAVIEEGEGTTTDPVSVDIPRHVYGEVIQSLEAECIVQGGLRLSAHLIAIRFSLRNTSVIDWFSKDKYELSVEEI